MDSTHNHKCDDQELQQAKAKAAISAATSTVTVATTAASASLWKLGLKKLERFRISSGYTIPSLFRLLNGDKNVASEGVLGGNDNHKRTTAAADSSSSIGKSKQALMSSSRLRRGAARVSPPGMPLHEFALKIRQYASSDITQAEATALAQELYRHVRRDEDFAHRSQPSSDNRWDNSSVNHDGHRYGHGESAHSAAHLMLLQQGDGGDEDKGSVGGSGGAVKPAPALTLLDKDAYISSADLEYVVAQQKQLKLAELKAKTKTKTKTTRNRKINGCMRKTDDKLSGGDCSLGVTLLPSPSADGSGGSGRSLRDLGLVAESAVSPAALSPGGSTGAGTSTGFASGLLLTTKSAEEVIEADEAKAGAAAAARAEAAEVRELVAVNPCFPPWLTAREDFLQYYDELKGTNGMPSSSVIEAVLKRPPEERRDSDLGIVSKWIKLHKILRHVRATRLIEVCRKMKLLECPAGCRVITEGDIGDAFYVILTGTCFISIQGAVVSELSAGCSFGEKALENNALRSATVTCSTECQFIVVFAADYKNIALCAQMISNDKRAQFLAEHCTAFSPELYSYPKIKSMSKRFVENTFPRKGTKIIRQNDAATALYIVLDGEVEISRVLSPEEYAHALCRMEGGMEESNSYGSSCRDGGNGDDGGTGETKSAGQRLEVDTIAEEEEEEEEGEVATSDSSSDSNGSSSDTDSIRLIGANDSSGGIAARVQQVQVHSSSCAGAFIESSISPITVCTSSNKTSPGTAALSPSSCGWSSTLGKRKGDDSASGSGGKVTKRRSMLPPFSPAALVPGRRNAMGVGVAVEPHISHSHSPSCHCDNCSGTDSGSIAIPMSRDRSSQSHSQGQRQRQSQRSHHHYQSHLLQCDHKPAMRSSSEIVASTSSSNSSNSSNSSIITASTWKKTCHYSLYITTLRPGDVFGEECIVEYLKHQHLGQQRPAPQQGDGENKRECEDESTCAAAGSKTRCKPNSFDIPAPQNYKDGLDRLAEHQRLNREYYHRVLAVKADIAREERRCQAEAPREKLAEAIGIACGDPGADELLRQHREEKYRGFAAFERSNSHPDELKRQVSIHDVTVAAAGAAAALRRKSSIGSTGSHDDDSAAGSAAAAAAAGAAAADDSDGDSHGPESNINNDDESGSEVHPLIMNPEEPKKEDVEEEVDRARHNHQEQEERLQREKETDETFYEVRERQRRARVHAQVGEPLDAAPAATTVVEPEKMHFSDYSAVSLTDKLRVVVLNKQEALQYFQSQEQLDALKASTADWRHSTLELLGMQINNRRREHLYRSLKSQALGHTYSRRKADYEIKQDFLRHQYAIEEQMKKSKTKGIYLSMSRSTGALSMRPSNQQQQQQISYDSIKASDVGSTDSLLCGDRVTSSNRVGNMPATTADTTGSGTNGATGSGLLLRNRRVSVDGTSFSDDEMQALIRRRNSRKRSMLLHKLQPLEKESQTVGKGKAKPTIKAATSRRLRRRSALVGDSCNKMRTMLAPLWEGCGSIPIAAAGSVGGVGAGMDTKD